MERLLTKKDLERQLEGKRADIDARIDALKTELETAGDDARKYFVEQPMKVAAGVIAAGVVIGLAYAGNRKRKRKRHLRKSHRRLVEKYADSLVNDVRYRLKRGDDEEKALRAAFRSRMPLIVVEGESEAEERRGMVREGVDLALKTALGFMVKVLVDRLSEQLDVEGRIERMVAGMVPATPPGGTAPQAPTPDERVG